MRWCGSKGRGAWGESRPHLSVIPFQSKSQSRVLRSVVRSADAIIALELSTPPWSKGIGNAKERRWCSGGQNRNTPGVTTLWHRARNHFGRVWMCVPNAFGVDCCNNMAPGADFRCNDDDTSSAGLLCPVTLMGHRKRVNCVVTFTFTHWLCF